MFFGVVELHLFKIVNERSSCESASISVPIGRSYGVRGGELETELAGTALTAHSPTWPVQV